MTMKPVKTIILTQRSIATPQVHGAPGGGEGRCFCQWGLEPTLISCIEVQSRTIAGLCERVNTDMINRIVFATGNEGKMAEIRAILSDLGIPVLSMKEAGVTADIVEDGKTFQENADIKAEAIMKLTGDVVLADDSGLEIDYLNGEPGIYSARYMGEDTSYDKKNRNLIERLEGVPDEKRTARFVCAISAALPDGTLLHSRGTIEGIIGYESKGENGFGYDPIFFLPEYQCTTAELSPEKKNELSHRGKALRMMKEKLMEAIDMEKYQ